MRRNEKSIYPFHAGDYVKFSPATLSKLELKELEKLKIHKDQILKIKGVMDNGNLYFNDTNQGFPTSEFELVKHRYAAFSDRFFSELLDGLLCLCIAYPFYLLVDKHFLGANHFIPDEFKDIGVRNVIIWAIFLYNATYLVGKTGQSWGRKFFEIKIIDYFGNPIGFWRSFFRNLFAITISSIGYLGFIWIIWDFKNQAWHDKVFRTYVICSTPKQK